MDGFGSQVEEEGGREPTRLAWVGGGVGAAYLN
jgi:hypothetical protein